MPGLAAVVLPYCPETTDAYVHLAGRTGRRDARGVALLVLEAHEARRVGMLASQTGVSFRPMEMGAADGPAVPLGTAAEEGHR